MSKCNNVSHIVRTKKSCEHVNENIHVCPVNYKVRYCDEISMILSSNICSLYIERLLNATKFNTAINAKKNHRKYSTNKRLNHEAMQIALSNLNSPPLFPILVTKCCSHT